MSEMQFKYWPSEIVSFRTTKSDREFLEENYEELFETAEPVSVRKRIMMLAEKAMGKTKVVEKFVADPEQTALIANLQAQAAELTEIKRFLADYWLVLRREEPDLTLQGLIKLMLLSLQRGKAFLLTPDDRKYLESLKR
jgi:hypothetical protein